MPIVVAVQPPRVGWGRGFCRHSPYKQMKWGIRRDSNILRRSHGLVNQLSVLHLPTVAVALLALVQKHLQHCPDEWQKYQENGPLLLRLVAIVELHSSWLHARLFGARSSQQYQVEPAQPGVNV